MRVQTERDRVIRRGKMKHPKYAAGYHAGYKTGAQQVAKLQDKVATLRIELAKLNPHHPLLY